VHGSPDRIADNRAMAPDSDDTVGFRLWPPFAVGLPWLAGVLATRQWGDPVELGEWRVPLGWSLVVFFVVWNGWALWLFARHDTALLPGQATTMLVEEGPYRVSRNPLYLGLIAAYLGLALLAPSVWAIVLAPVAVLLLLWGSIWPEERYLRARFGESYAAYTKRVRRWL
jgi:protein-S-isoprenylcysteine O-methyltransferase Ste14